MSLSLVLGLLLLADHGASKRAAGPELFVRTDNRVTVERLAQAVSPIGMVESRQRGTRCYLIQLKPDIDDEWAKQRLEKIPGVKALEPAEEPVDMTSMRSLNRKVAHMMAESGRDEADKDGKDNDAGLDYLRAYQYFVGRRAFPNDSFDWSLEIKAREHAHQMPATVFPGTQPHANIASLGQYWQFMGPTNLGTPPGAIDFGIGPTNGRVNAVAFDPKTPTTIYAGAAQGGLWTSTNAGLYWTWLSASWTQLGVNCIVIDPVSPKTIYVGRGDLHGRLGLSYGLMKSVDGGQTWNEILEGYTGIVGCCSLLMDPTNDQVLIAGTQGNGTWYSSNAGATWSQQIYPFDAASAIYPTIASSTPNNGNVRFYAIEGGTGGNSGLSRLFVSDDHGQSWNRLASPMVDNAAFHQGYEIATSPTNPNEVYILDAENTELYSSQNQGANWTDLGPYLPFGPTNNKKPNYNFSQANYDYHLECGNRVNGTANSDVLYLGLIDIQESLDQGKTWSSIGGPSWLTQAQGGITHNDQHSLAVCPTNPNLALFSNDGGVYQLVYNPSTQKNAVTSLNADLANTMFYHIACHPTDPEKVMGGTQDNGTPFMSDNILNWLNFTGGDGGGCAINQSNPSIAYSTSENLNIYRTDSFSSTNTGINPKVPNSENLPFVAPIVLDPNNQSLMYTGTNYLYQWNDSQQQWTNDLGGVDLTNDSGQAGGLIAAIAIAASDSTRIYTGSNDGKLSISVNQGKNWQTMTPPANGAISSISVNPSDSGDLLIGYSGGGGGHLYRYVLTDFSANYYNVSGSGSTALPNTPLNAIARDLDDPVNTWYVATDSGIFQTNNGGLNWTNTSYLYGLPDVLVDDLVAVAGTRTLNAGTYGRGLWTLYLPPNGANLKTFTLSPTTIAGGNTATGTITLSNPAGNGGMTIKIKGNGAAASYPSSVTVAAGQTTASFTVIPNPVSASATAFLYATQSSISINQNIEVVPATLAPLNLGPRAVLGGASFTASVNLTGPTVSSMKVNLTSSSSDVQVPKSVTIAANSSSADFNLTTTPVSANVNATITATPASGGAAQSAKLEVEPPTLTGLSVSPVLVSGTSGTAVTGTLTFDGATPSGGVVVKLLSTNTAVATVPASITVKLANGATTATFPITTKKVSTAQTVTIEAEYPSGTWQTANLGVLPFLLTNITTSPTTVNGGSDAQGTVQVSGAPTSASGAVTVKLSSNSKSATVPSAVTIAIGKTSATFNVSTTAVASNTSAIISGSLNGGTLTTTVYIQAPTVVSLIISPTSVSNVNTKVTGTVTISGPAPAGGTVVNLSSSTSSASVPKTVTVAAGQHTASFTITHKAAGFVNVTATITASVGASSASGTLTIKT